MKSKIDFTKRDPEDRVLDQHSLKECREKMLDKTIADSFPASDPPSSIPDPCADSFEAVASNSRPRKVA